MLLLRIMGDSRKYPYPTADGILEFRGQGGFFGLEFRRHVGFLGLEFRRHGGFQFWISRGRRQGEFRSKTRTDDRHDRGSRIKIDQAGVSVPVNGRRSNVFQQ